MVVGKKYKSGNNANYHLYLSMVAMPRKNLNSYGGVKKYSKEKFCR